MRKLKCILLVLFRIHFLLSLFGTLFRLLFFTECGHLGDIWIYKIALTRYLGGENFYQEYFGYFPSFFFFFSLFSTDMLYAMFLVLSTILGSYFLFKIDDGFGVIVCGICLLTIFGGNIDPFMFMVICVCIYLLNNRDELLNKNKILLYNILVCILLAAISFKPSVILIFPYFIYRMRESLSKWIIIYGVGFILFNFYFILHPEYIFYFLDYTIVFFGTGNAYLRPFWLWYIYYYWLLNTKFK